MKLFGRARRSDKTNPNKPKDILVPPELQQYYQVEQTTAGDSRRKKIFLVMGGVVLAALIVTGAVLLIVHLTNQTAPGDKVQISVTETVVPTPKGAPQKLPEFDKTNTQAITQPAAL